MASEFVTTGFVKKGELKVRNQRAMKEWTSKLRDCEVIVRIEKAHATRSLDQNALYWSGYVRPLSEHTGYEPTEIHAYLKKKFLPNQHLMIQNAQGEVIDETDLEPTTRKLNKIEFGEYLRAVKTWAREELGVQCGTSREMAA